MELAANVWLVADAGAGLVPRYFMCAYAIDAEDKVISMVLQTLAPTSFRAANAFKLASSFSKRSEHGTLRTREGLDLWLALRGLWLQRPSPDDETHDASSDSRNPRARHSDRATWSSSMPPFRALSDRELDAVLEALKLIRGAAGLSVVGVFFEELRSSALVTTALFLLCTWFVLLFAKAQDRREKNRAAAARTRQHFEAQRRRMVARRLDRRRLAARTTWE